MNKLAEMARHDVAVPVRALRPVGVGIESCHEQEERREPSETLKPKRRIRRGYSAVALDRPQKDSSLGGAMRAAGVYLGACAVGIRESENSISPHPRLID